MVIRIEDVVDKASNEPLLTHKFQILELDLKPGAHNAQGNEMTCSIA